MTVTYIRLLVVMNSRMKFYRYSLLILIPLGLECMISCSNPRVDDESPEVIETCIKEQLLSINREDNPELFDYTKESIDIFSEIRDLALSEEIRLWEGDNEDIYLSAIGFWKIHDSIYDINVITYYNKYFDFMSQGYAPIKNHLGEDSLRALEDGSQVYIYPHLKYEPIDMSKVTELRVKEIRTNDLAETKNLFKPTFVGFDVFTVYHKVHFWVKLEDLEKKIKINKDWVKNIRTGNYNGFPYLRIRCSDPEYDIRKVYH